MLSHMADYAMQRDLNISIFLDLIHIGDHRESYAVEDVKIENEYKASGQTYI